MLNISLDDLGRDFVTDGSDKVAVFPKLATPQLSLNLGMLPKNGACTQTLEARHDLGDRQARRERTKNMHMVLAHFHLFNADVVGLGNLFEQLLQALANDSRQDFLAVFRCPHQMILCVVNAVRATSKRHASIVAPTLFPTAAPLHSFIPAASGGDE